MNNWKTLTTIAGGVITLITLFTVLGFKFPLAFAVDVETNKQEIQSTKEIATEAAKATEAIVLELRLTRLENKAQRLRDAAKTRDLTDLEIETLRDLELEIKKIERELE